MNALRILPLLAASSLFVVPGTRTALALDPSTPIAQYAHSAWNVADGTFAGSPNTVAQTADGYIWIGTNLGLVRFDGARFVQWNPPAGERLQDSRVFSLLGSQDGSLWIGTGYGLARWKDGRLTNYAGLSGRIEALLEDSAGSIWLARTQITDRMGPVCRIRADQLSCFGKADKVPFPNVLQLARSDDGYIWLVGYSELTRWKPGAGTIYFPDRTNRQEGIPLFNAIAAAPDSSAWIAMNEPEPMPSLQRYSDRRWTRQQVPRIGVKGSLITSLFVDRDNELWIGTRFNGVFRVRDGNVEHYDRTDGLSSNSVLGFYQDREGSVWLVTSAGIDNFRDLHVLSWSMREGLTSDAADSVLASRDGGLWVLNDYNTVQKLKDGKFTTILPRPGLAGHVSTIFEDHAGRLWIGFEDGMYVYENGSFRAILRDNGSQLGLVFSITEDTDDNIWVRDKVGDQANLDEVTGYRLARETASSQIATGFILTAAPDGSIDLGLVNGDLLEFRNGELMRTIPSHETGNTSQIRDLLVDPDGTIWGTNLNELIAWKGAARRNLTVSNGLPCENIFALTEDDSHAIWLYAQCGLIRITRAELDRWWQHPSEMVRTTLLNEGDGVHAGLTSLKPQATRTADGRLWFANGRIVQMFDPGHERTNPTPPPVEIESVIGDRRSYPIEDLHLPPVTRDLEIHYTALTYVAPPKVFFRYKLEGRDVRWQEAGGRRAAFYTDLTPGTYRFHVIASNNDGVWNEVGAALQFTVAPAWYQMLWFRLLCVLIAASIVWIGYRIRMHQMAVVMNQRFDERLNERTRLARDLHDTLLQTIQASKMIAEDALDPQADRARMQNALTKLSAWMGRAMIEGRAALQSLRSSTTERNDLADALRRATESDQLPGSMSVSLSVTGSASEMHPIVRDEIYLIGYEAIRNAALHSGASRLEIELRYAQDLTLRVRDNGAGIDPALLHRGKPGHFGLQGMRERASRIGGKLTMTSSHSAGTEIQLIVPGGIIFSKTPSRTGLQSRVRRLFERRH